MVKGRAKFRARLAKIPGRVITEVKAAMEKSARQIVASMNAAKPIPEIEIDWTWGDEPAGAVKLVSLRDRGASARNDLRITIYATAYTEEYPRGGPGFPAVARWFEFGTEERIQKSTGRATGRIEAQPFFYPVWRSSKQAAKARMTRAVRRGLTKA